MMEGSAEAEEHGSDDFDAVAEAGLLKFRCQVGPIRSKSMVLAGAGPLPLPLLRRRWQTAEQRLGARQAQGCAAPRGRCQTLH